MKHVVIIGAGFSGALQAINLLRHDGPRATLIERRIEVAGRGVAYSAAHPAHLLNVRADRMSALPDDPEHFLSWLRLNRPELGEGFVPRAVYGDYLDALLNEAVANTDRRLTIMSGEVIDLEPGADGIEVITREGANLRADAVILALGNLPPHEPPALATASLDPDVYASDPWAADIAEGLEAEDVVLTIGSGLTMVDVALLLSARGFRGRTIALSRRGLLPRVHEMASAGLSTLSERPAAQCTALLDATRFRAANVGWRNAVDELRPHTQALWLAATPEERGRFLRHLRPWWDVHRHRLAPSVADKLGRLRATGALEIHAGKLVSARRVKGGVQVLWRRRGVERLETLSVRRIVNCSGPQGDLYRTNEPLLRKLLTRKLIRADANRLGIDVTPQAEIIGQDGRINSRLFALGPMTRGTFWEIVAVPDIRVQTWSLARRLSNAHWVEGHGL